MNFFFDNNLSPKLAEAMNLLEQEGNVIHLTKIFPPNTKDEDWLEYIGKKGMILITQDKQIKKRAAELRAFKKYKVGAFILGGKNPEIWQIVKQVINKWLEIKNLASKTRLPFMFKVPLRGKITQLSFNR
jgi:predicted nuclease of predicted toxin-antitoxin system